MSELEKRCAEQRRQIAESVKRRGAVIEAQHRIGDGYWMILGRFLPNENSMIRADRPYVVWDWHEDGLSQGVYNLNYREAWLVYDGRWDHA